MQDKKERAETEYVNVLLVIVEAVGFGRIEPEYPPIGGRMKQKKPMRRRYRLVNNRSPKPFYRLRLLQILIIGIYTQGLYSRCLMYLLLGHVYLTMIDI
ncbi:unnamed protein product [Lactuca virosa]|uniref:Transmembrane protein n=1 Tax=Lactuca virosa TaxID=75947 RepID=A0AAU9N8D1_9ASTR|nr:unnamed protein product [Lactuca virosa]